METMNILRRILLPSRGLKYDVARKVATYPVADRVPIRTLGKPRTYLESMGSVVTSMLFVERVDTVVNTRIKPADMNDMRESLRLGSGIFSFIEPTDLFCFQRDLFLKIHT